MLAYILLACIGAVGALGLVAMVRVAIRSLRKGREQRARLAARRRLAAESRSSKRAAVAVTAPAERPAHVKPARPMTPAPIVPLARGELTSVINLLDESARFALRPPPAPPRRLPKASFTPMTGAPVAAAPVAAAPNERPAWADGVVPKRGRRPSAEVRTVIERPVRTEGPRHAPPFGTPVMRVPAPPPMHHAAPATRLPAPPPVHHAAPATRLPAPPPPVHHAAPGDTPATRIPVPPPPVHHAAPGVTRVPVPPLPLPRRSRSS